MLKRIFFWEICVVLSFFVEKFCGQEQGKAFLHIYFVTSAFIIFALVGSALIINLSKSNVKEILVKLFFPLLSGLIMEMVIILLISWEVEIILGIDFYIFSQIISFILCLSICYDLEIKVSKKKM